MLYAKNGAEELHKGPDLSRVAEPELSQPLCTALQIALVELLDTWNIRPSMVVGHSSGEIGAAYCAGLLSHGSAIKVAYWRGSLAAKLMENQSDCGGMISIALSEEDALPYLSEEAEKAGQIVSVGCVNSPSNITVTGGKKAIRGLQKRMNTLGIFAKTLQTGVAYHSQYMQAISSEYQSKLGNLTARDGSISAPTMISSVTGQRLDGSSASTAQYWAMNLVSKVQFQSALAAMASTLLENRKKHGSNPSGRDILLEVGPHSALQRPVKDTLQQVPKAKEFVYDSMLSRESPSISSLASIAGRLWCHGCPIDLMRVNYPDVDLSNFQVLADLPGYSFNHSQVYWQESRLSRNLRLRKYRRHELLGVRDTDWNHATPKWRNIIRLSESQWIRDHQVRLHVCVRLAAFERV